MALRQSNQLCATGSLRVDGLDCCSLNSVGLVGPFAAIGVSSNPVPLEPPVTLEFPGTLAFVLDANGETTKAVPLVNPSVPVKVPTLVVLGLLLSVRSDTTDGSAAVTVS